MTGASYARKYPEKHKLQAKAYREKNKEKVKEWALKSYHKKKQDPKNIVHYLLKQAKARATKKDLPFSITKEDIILPELCPYFKVPFDRNTRKWGYSLDRIDPKQGYVQGNIQVISQLANAMKWDSTPEELIQFAKGVLEKEGSSTC